MTNREKYKQAFSAIRASDNFSLEAEKMERTAKQHRFRTMAAIVAVCATLVGGAAAAYAADAGGIQRAVQVWIHGDQTAATIQFDGNGSYSMEYTDGEGNVRHQSGGGAWGNEIPAGTRSGGRYSYGDGTRSTTTERGSQESPGPGQPENRSGDDSDDSVSP